MAGSETQVMSLWQVDTGRTRELMQAYYQRLQDGDGRSEAMRQVQLAMLADKKTSHPNLWASFIVSGDWRPLDNAPIMPDGRVHPGPRGCACSLAGERDAEGWPSWVLAVLTLSAVAGRRRLRGNAPR
jgi:MYXO-CTERM domain-containing protein